MTKYYSKFMETGIRTQADVIGMSEEKFEEMKIPLGHKLKIIKKVKLLRK